MAAAEHGWATAVGAGGHSLVLDQLAVAVMVGDANVWQRDARKADLLSRRLDLGLAGDDLGAILVDAATIEQEYMVLGSFFRHRHRGGDGVAQANRPGETQ